MIRFSEAVAEALKEIKVSPQVKACTKLFEKAKALYEEFEAAAYEFTKVSLANARFVKDYVQAEAEARAEMLGLRDETYKVTCLYISKNITRNVADRTYTRATYYVPVKRAAVQTATNGCITGIERYTDLYVNVTIDGEEHASFLNEALYRKDDEFFHARKDGFHNILVKGQVLPKNEFFRSDGKLLPGILVYLSPKKSGYENLTAGQSKTFTVPCVAVNHPKVDAHILKYLLTYGACELLQQGDKEVTQNDLATGNNRLAQNEAPNTPLGIVKKEAYFMGKYKAFGYDYRDGFAFTLDRSMELAFTRASRGRTVFDKGTLRGTGAQKRPHLSKVFSEVTEDGYIYRFITRSHKPEDIVYLIRSEVTEEIQEAFRMAVMSKGKEGPFAGKVIVIVDSEDDMNLHNIDFFTDLNGLKAPFDLRMHTTWNILEYTHTPHDVKTGAHLSGQLLQTLFIADWKRAFAFVRSCFKKAIESKKESFSKGRTLRTEDFGDNPRWTDLLQAINPRLVTHYYFPLLKQVVKATLKGLVGMADRFGIPTEGCYTKVVPDPAADFEKRHLHILKNGMVEILAPAFEGTEFDEVILTKYPKQHYREFTHCKVVSRKEYMERVMADPDLCEEDKRLLCRKVDQLSGGLTVVPAYKALLDLHAGMDFDGDGVIAYANKILVKIVTKVLKSLVVSINPDD